MTSALLHLCSDLSYCTTAPICTCSTLINTHQHKQVRKWQIHGHNELWQNNKTESTAVTSHPLPDSSVLTRGTWQSWRTLGRNRWKESGWKSSWFSKECQGYTKVKGAAPLKTSWLTGGPISPLFPFNPEGPGTPWGKRFATYRLSKQVCFGIHCLVLYNST